MTDSIMTFRELTEFEGTTSSRRSTTKERTAFDNSSYRTGGRCPEKPSSAHPMIRLAEVALAIFILVFIPVYMVVS